MSLELWTAVDRYVSDKLLPSDPVLDAVLQTSAEAGLPNINVSPSQGKLLHMLAKLQGARTILEIGTLGAYSTIWLARALPADGRLITIEADPHHADIARTNIACAGFTKMVELRVGKALDVLPQIAAEAHGPFDLIFIDADKASMPQYFTWALKLARRGSLIVADNVIRKGAVANPSDPDPSVQGVRQLMELLAKDSRVTATAIQTVGIKGYDGFALILVTADP